MGSHFTLKEHGWPLNIFFLKYSIRKIKKTGTKYVKSGFFLWQGHNLLEQFMFSAQLWSSTNEEPNNQVMQPKVLMSEQGTPAFIPLGTEP